MLMSAYFSPVKSISIWALGSAPAVLLVVSLIALDNVGGERFRIADVAPGYVCDGAAPRVCLAEGTTRPLKPLAKGLAEQAGMLSQLGIQVPDTFYQEVPGVPAKLDAGLFIFTVDEVNASDISADRIASFLAMPAACPAYFSPTTPPVKALRAQGLIAMGLFERSSASSTFAQVAPGSGSADPVQGWVTSNAWNEWAKATYPKLKSCDLDSIDLPF
ncbi:hypothetical protein GCM10009661_35140 [Catellatospora chokoriensis]|uniref:Uncharacterized protein n=2 Tax=Catellatospora chokoriensis TaxID=310353 RepID=A0A8J3K2P4_9ACTN|nr:hypothetical protein Cch02nite_27420 [Catellatospora chokoriensis]